MFVLIHCSSKTKELEETIYGFTNDNISIMAVALPPGIEANYRRK